MRSKRKKRKNGLLPKQRKFIEAVGKGLTQQDASRLVGYSDTYGSTLMKKLEVREALDKAGLGDKALSTYLKRSIKSGVGVKSTNSDAISGIRLANELRGNLHKEPQNAPTQNNIYIKELKALDDTALLQKVTELTESIKQISG